MEYEVLRSGTVLLPFFVFTNEEGVMAFAANDLDADWRGRARPHGYYRSVAEIPGNLLAEGMLFVSVGLITDTSVVQFYEADAVAFHVVDSIDGNSARGDYAGTMEGVMRPMLKWQTFFKRPGASATKTKEPCADSRTLGKVAG
jgi:lipopolysaccharide transport system ATP-binding protein